MTICQHHATPFKYCPKCQSTRIESTNGHQFNCADCQYEYFHNTASAVAAIICCADELLFTVRANEPEKGKLDLPGGFVDHRETLEQALSREIKEELSIEINQWQYFCSGSNTYEYKNVKYFTCDVIFVAQLATKPDITKQASEITDYQWIAKSAINANEIGFTSLRQAVQKFIN